MNSTELEIDLKLDQYVLKEEWLSLEALNISPQDVSVWQNDLLNLTRLIRKVSLLYAGDKYPIRKDYLKVVEHYKNIPSSRLSPILRADGLIVNRQLKVIEFNVDSAIGGFWELDKLQNFLKMNDKNPNGFYPSPKKFWIEFFEDFAKRLRRPIYVGIVGSSFLEESNRKKVQEVTQWLNHSEWLIARYVEPQELKAGKDKVQDQYYSYDLLYRYRCLLHPEEQAQEMINIYLSAQNKKTLVLSDPLDLLIEQKAVLALLYFLKEDTSIFNLEDKELIQKYIPWTYFLNQPTVVFQGKSHSLKDLLSEQPSAFVLKRFYSHHGDHVLIGAQCSEVEWKQKVEDAFKNPQDWIVQERLISDTAYFSYTNQYGETYKKKKHYFFSPYIFGKNFAGAFIRVQQKENQQVLSVPALSPMGLAGLKIGIEND